MKLFSLWKMVIDVEVVETKRCVTSVRKVKIHLQAPICTSKACSQSSEAYNMHHMLHWKSGQSEADAVIMVRVWGVS
ncbi:uncharacterized protein MYCFIDRAFT_175856 [Pseudocercospora fijiensis CIRAD86]|uniref:Uncharacterized protein n=1 Tax=Pseudocercospora fijiensis (strain CIRAD86) TaxID=383855 RepID=M3AYS4_PSEFD|nr:uncharacterized protein MYCFIDRAFT_175856 [Pseudocercospora fijiensis CIRAD86]EME82313.1 hypothetical protein MYCFIDRAFT_175856 [Pseudocercospora fijiensis CIRAD86]